MNRITTAAIHCIVTTAIKCSWAVQAAGERKQALGERMEAWAHRLAVRWGCVDTVLATVTSDILSR
ncbi:hypothetical protein JQ607_30315 [Bradyrhizobium liaoningense]|uniref:hypothetical protein n=1 Tax=Bradyrhizobium liaoningense TaxID=43992 RepID=UPI001BA4F831|nr:hypothetical protein [Bradyrhizobium liaoningense]MBR0844517.1 hypothetical protein [Bradyrhizobium liaoningense]